MRANTREAAAALIAAGVDPQRSILFVQSSVPAHAQLAWVLSCVSPIGWLNRMTQFKEKAGKDRENAPVGLFTYPVLMAADILAYQATHVPVGEDQKQHLELARDIAGSFNRRFGVELFPLPEPMILGEATRVMSLRDGTKKMSKSDSSEQSRISLIDDADTIALKFRRAKSDSILGISYDPENRPEASNLLTIFAALAERPRAEVETDVRRRQLLRVQEPSGRPRGREAGADRRARCAACRPTPAISTAFCATAPSGRPSDRRGGAGAGLRRGGISPRPSPCSEPSLGCSGCRARAVPT